MATELSPEVLSLLQNHNEETVKIKPIESGLVNEPDEQSANYWKVASDMALSVPQGIVNSIEEQGDFIDENIVSLGGLEFGDGDGKLSFKDFIPRYITPQKWKAENYSEKRQLPVFHKPETLAGNMTEGISRFLTGFAGPAKFLKGAGMAGTTYKAASRGLIAGAYSDLTVFDPTEGRLSDMLVEFDSPVLNNAVTQYLATDEHDTEMQGRLKNVLEGMSLGLLTESIFIGIKAYKKMKRTNNLDERAKIQENANKLIVKSQKQKEKLKPIDVGVKVKALDRENIGTVIGKDGKKLFLVKFVSPEGATATKSFAKKDLVSVDKVRVKKSLDIRKFNLEGDSGINIKEAVKTISKSKETAKQDAELWLSKIFNTKSFRSGREVLHSIDNVVQNGFDDVTKEYLENDVLANSVALELAEIAGKDQKQILKSITKEGIRSKDGVVKMLTAKMFLQKAGDDFLKVSTKYLDEFGEDVNNWSKAAREEMAMRGMVIREVTYSLKEQIRNAARVTQGGNIKVTKSDGKILEVEQIAKNIKNFSTNPAVLAKKIKGMKAKDVIDEIGKTKSHKFIEVFNSLYINSLLSGTYTHAVNFLSNSYELFLKPLEQITGGALRADLRAMRTGVSQYYGMIFSIGDTIKAVGTALRQGDAILDPLSRTQDNLKIVNGKAQRPISGANLGFNGVAGNMIDMIGLVSEFPTRLLMASDELFKQLNYRGRLYANAIDNTLELGLKVGSKEGKANIDKIFKNGFDENGMANVKDNDIAADALQNARIATFTNSLEDGRLFNIGGAWNKFLKSAPYLRFLSPFVRTPTNLWRQFETRIPVYGGFTKPMKDLWKTGDRRARAEVLGRQAFGTSIALYAWHLTQEVIEDKNGNQYPKITGNGPEDFRIKKTWLQNGWQPYSIAQKNEDGTITYKQYNRMDPRFYIFGILADMNENRLNINDENKENIVAVAFLSAMKSALNKSYLRGIADAVETAQEATPDKFTRYFGKQVGNAIPYQALVNQGVYGIVPYDTDMLEARGFVDEIIKKTPFIDKNEYLEKRLDIITGEPVERNPNSVYFNPEGGLSFLSLLGGPALVGKKSLVQDDPITFELARLKISLAEPSKVREKKVNLLDYKIDGQTAHHYLTERIGKTKIRGLTFKQYLERTINSTAYKRRKEGDENFDGGKEFTIKKIFEAYKKKAYSDMLKKYKNVAKDIKAAKIEKYKLLRPNSLYNKNIKKELLPSQ